MRTVLLVMLALGCQSPPAVVRPAPPQPTLDVPAAALPARGTLMLGEIHGTREIPAYVGELVASVVQREPVVLALEIPVQHAAPVHAYLASDGSPASRQRMVTTAWWQGAVQDGRRSVAMADLIETVRALRAAGKRIEVVLIDDETRPTAEEREESMARNVIAARRAHPDAALIVFAGNLHTSTQERDFKPGFVWMAMRVANAGIKLVSLNARFSDGTAWVCLGGTEEQCGVAFAPGRHGGRDSTPGGFHFSPAPGNYHGWFGVGAISASPPAGIPALGADLDAKIAAAVKSTQAVESKARRAYTEKDYATCAAIFSQIEKPSAGAAYDHACCLALTGRKDEAFDRLRYAMANGFRDLAHMEKDPDLASLHDDPRWPIKP
jgi:hypothetical protein